MKFFPYLIILLCGPSLVFAADWSKLPSVRMPRGVERDFDFVKENMAKLHPWNAGMALPNNFKEAGLEQPVRLVNYSFYFDGGSRAYLFKGANDKFLIVCTTPKSGSLDGRKTLKRESATLYLGVWHFSDKARTAIPIDSKTEEFLLAAIQSEAERISALSKPKGTGATDRN